MSASVLGKRTRTSPCPAVDSTERQTRSSKRRAIAVLGNDENNNPFITRSSPIVEIEKRASISTNTSTSPVQTRPAKHGAPQSKVAATPTKITSLFSVAKPATSVNYFKDGKVNPLATPSTPRHRDALSKKVAVTPRHRIQISNSPATPRTPSTPSISAPNVYNQARQIFATCTDPAVLVGREEEKNQVSTFVSNCLNSNHGGCLYISGPPGTGKSAFVGGVCENFTTSDNIAKSTVNCMSVKNAKDLANTLCEGLDILQESARNADFDFLRTHFLGEQDQANKYIIVLDEIDRLVDLDLKLLYSLFEWSMLPSSNLILIGIANALDLTDRFLPRLKSRELKPDLLPFMPYTAPQIANILTCKLRSLSTKLTDSNFIPFLHPAAIQFVSKKVASQTGDLRKAFDICHRAITLIESETKASAARLRLSQSDSPSKTQATPLMENINLCSPTPAATPTKPLKQTTLNLSSSLSHLTVETAPRASIAHMAKITAQVFSNGTSQRLTHLNIQQKAVLCSLAAYEKKKRESPSTSIFATPSKKTPAESSAPTIKQLYETYTALCKRENLLHALTGGEFRDVVSGLETLSLVQNVEGRGGSSFVVPVTPSKTPSRRGRAMGSGLFAATGDERRMAACVGFKELMDSLKGPGSEILREILEGGVA